MMKTEATKKPSSNTPPELRLKRTRPLKPIRQFKSLPNQRGLFDAVDELLSTDERLQRGSDLIDSEEGPKSEPCATASNQPDSTDQIHCEDVSGRISLSERPFTNHLPILSEGTDYEDHSLSNL